MMALAAGSSAPSAMDGSSNGGSLVSVVSSGRGHLLVKSLSFGSLPDSEHSC